MNENVTETVVMEEEQDNVIDIVPEQQEVPLLDENDPLSAQNLKQIEAMMKNIEIMVRVMQEQWEASVKELSLNDSHMKELAAWNDNHKTQAPEDLTEEQRSEWDYLNGIDSLTEEEVLRIFGEDHPVYGVDHTQTVDRIKGACKDFFAYLTTMREYTNIHNAYIQLVELEEMKTIAQMEEVAKNEEDPVKKEKLLKDIEAYYDKKYLGWLSKPFQEDEKKRILNVLSDGNKISYWMERCRSHLKQLKISQKFILQISQFEKRFLDEKYHKANNLLLLYFMQVSGYVKTHDPKDENRMKTIAMVLALDAFIRGTLPEESKEKVLNNIIAFEDQFIDHIKEPMQEDIITPPVTEE